MFTPLDVSSGRRISIALSAGRRCGSL